MVPAFSSLGYIYLWEELLDLLVIPLTFLRNYFFLSLACKLGRHLGHLCVWLDLNLSCFCLIWSSFPSSNSSAFGLFSMISFYVFWLFNDFLFIQPSVSSFCVLGLYGPPFIRFLILRKCVNSPKVSRTSASCIPLHCSLFSGHFCESWNKVECCLVWSHLGMCNVGGLRFFTALLMFVNEYGSAANTDLGVTKKCLVRRWICKYRIDE